MVPSSSQADAKASGRPRYSMLLNAQRQFVLQQRKSPEGARFEPDSGQQVRGHGLVETEPWRGRLENGGRRAERRRRSTGDFWTENRISQSPAGVHGD